MRTKDNSDLQEHVRNVIVRWRKIADYTQEEIAKAIGKDRTAWNKKEKGLTPVTFEDLQALTEAFSVPLADLFKGYPGFYYEQKNRALPEKTVKKFPFIEQIVKMANVAAETESEDDRQFFIQTMKYGLSKLLGIEIQKQEGESAVEYSKEPKVFRRRTKERKLDTQSE